MHLLVWLHCSIFGDYCGTHPPLRCQGIHAAVVGIATRGASACSLLPLYVSLAATKHNQRDSEARAVIVSSGKTKQNSGHRQLRRKIWSRGARASTANYSAPKRM